MMELQYFRGLRELYKEEVHGHGIYFAIDTKEILHNGLSFLGDLPKELEEALVRIGATEDAVSTINDSLDLRINTAVNTAIDAFANAMSDNNVVDTFKELVEYAANNTSDLGALIVRVDGVEQKNAEQDLAITKLQEDLLVIKGNMSDDLALQRVEIEKSIDEKITNAFSWEDVK